MASSPKLFQFVQKFYQTMGIFSSQPSQLIWLNVKKIFFLFFITASFISISSFFLFKASTISEYGSSFSGALSDLYALLDLLITIWQMPNILKLIRMFEIFIEKSK